MAKSGKRYQKTDYWHMFETGHTKVLNSFGIVECIVFMLSCYDFMKNFTTLISATESKLDIVVDIVGDSVQIFTYGFTNLSISWRYLWE